MNKRTFIMRDIFSSLGTVITLSVLYIYFFSIMNSAGSINNTDYMTFIWGIAFILILILDDTFLRYKCKNIFIYLGGHVVPLALPFIAGVSVYALIPLVCIWIFVIYSAISYWKTEELQKSACAIEFPSELIIIYIGIFFHCYYGISKASAYAVYICGIIFFILSIMNRYFHKIILNVQSATGSNRKVDSSQYNMNTFMIILFVCFIFFVCIGIGLVFSDTSFNFVGQFFKLIGAGIVALIRMISKKQGVTHTGEAETSAPVRMQHSAQSIQNSNPLFEAIFNIFQVVIYFAIAFAIIYGVYSFFRTNMNKAKFADDDEPSNENKDKVVKLKPKRSFRNIFTPLSNRDKIRKLYKNKVNSFMKHNVKVEKSNTPAEICSAVVKTTGVSIKDITKIYEKARYSNDEITKDEVACCKKMM